MGNSTKKPALVNVENQRVLAELKQAELRFEVIYGDTSFRRDHNEELDSGNSQNNSQSESSNQGKHQGDRIKYARKELLVSARESINCGEIFNAWGYILAFNRMMVSALHGAELDAKIVSARSEAKKKLGGWRGESAKALLSLEDNTDEQDKQDRLREALFHLHSKSQNTYFKIEKIKNQILAAMCMLAFSSFCVFGLSFWFMGLAFFSGISLYEFHLAILAGLIGGVLSVAFSVVRTDPNQKIPEPQASFPLTWTRPLFGPLVAFALLVLMQLEFINFGDIKTQSLIGMSFFAGFSERWFLNLVSKMQEKAGAR